MDAHAERKVGAESSLDGRLDARLRIEGDTDSKPELTSRLDHVPGLVGNLDVEGDAVSARVLDLAEMVLRVVDHEMAVDPPAPAVDQRGDRLQNDRADRHGLDEMAVPDVEMKDPRPRAKEVLDLVAEAGEVSRVEGRLDLRGSHPLPPAHPAHSKRGAARRRIPPCRGHAGESAETRAVVDGETRG